MPNPGDYVRVKTKKDELEGILIQSHEKEIIFLKLKSGYNIGINKKDVKKITSIKKAKITSKKNSIKQNIKLPKISILHTGGTIASKVDYKTGGVISSFTPEDIVSMFPELSRIANIDSELVANMWSEDLRFEHFKLIAKAIEKKVKNGTQGIIIGIGTDNLAVASAALSFIIEQTPVPIIFVGSQRSSDRGSSDAAMNLICAAEFITKTNFTGVAICMHEHSDDKTCAILPACKTKKLHSSRRDAFKVVNDSIIARINYNTKEIEFIKNDYKKKDKKTKLIIKPAMEEKTGLLKIHTNMFSEQFKCYKDYKGLVIEGTGIAGNIPIGEIDKLTKEHTKIKKELKKLIDSGTIIVTTSNCLFGRINTNVYSRGREQTELGIISGQDMLAETAFVKLAWLLANHKKEAKELISKNLRGEINLKHSYKKQII